MKEVTKQTQKLIDETINELYANSDPTLPVATSSMVLPFEVFYDFEKKRRFFEVESISDLVNNYKTISKATLKPFSLYKTLFMNKFNRELFISTSDKPIKVITDKEQEEYNVFANPNPGGKFLENFNNVSMDSVNIHNFRFIKRETFEACEFVITDKNKNNIPAIMVYKNFPHNELNVDAYRQLQNVFYSSDLTKFDLQFYAMSETHKVRLGKIYRGKKLLVYEIIRSDGTNDNEITPPVENNDMPLNVLSPPPAIKYFSRYCNI